jgi:hypothetical protein
MRELRLVLWSVCGVGLLCLCAVGLTGCDSRPGDGTVIPGAGPVTEEQKSKVAAHYEDRKNKAANKKAPGKK